MTADEHITLTSLAPSLLIYQGEIIYSDGVQQWQQQRWASRDTTKTHPSL